MRARVTPFWLVGALLLLLLVVAGCALVRANAEAPAPPAIPEPMPAAGVGEELALVDEIDVLILESMPVQVRVVARGHLNDAATVIDRVTQSLDGDTIVVRILTARDPDAMAAQVLAPFEQSIPLDLQGLGIEPGAYTIDVNGVTATLTLEPAMLGR